MYKFHGENAVSRKTKMFDSLRQLRGRVKRSFTCLRSLLPVAPRGGMWVDPL